MGGRNSDGTTPGLSFPLNISPRHDSNSACFFSTWLCDELATRSRVSPYDSWPQQTLLPWAREQASMENGWMTSPPPEAFQRIATGCVHSSQLKSIEERFKNSTVLVPYAFSAQKKEKKNKEKKKFYFPFLVKPSQEFPHTPEKSRLHYKNKIPIHLWTRPMLLHGYQTGSLL